MVYNVIYERKRVYKKGNEKNREREQEYARVHCMRVRGGSKRESKRERMCEREGDA